MLNSIEWQILPFFVYNFENNVIILDYNFNIMQV